MLTIYTSTIRSDDPDKLDITVKGDDTLGRFFAPDWAMVQKYLNGPKDAQAEFDYEKAYHQKMTDSYIYNRREWERLLSMDRVVLVCFCKPGAFCHRKILAKYLVHLGAEYGGEI